MHDQVDLYAHIGNELAPTTRSASSSRVKPSAPVEPSSPSPQRSLTPDFSDSSEEHTHPSTMTGITLPSGIIIQPGALPTIPNIPITAIDAAFCDDINNAFNNYFDGLTKPIAENIRVARGIGCFSTCLPISNWISTKRTELVALTWNEFMVQLRLRFLKEDWHVTLRLEMTRRIMKEKDDFVVWIEQLIAMNNRLRSTISHLNDTEFISVIGANVWQHLYRKAVSQGVYNTVIYDTIAKWQTEMNKLEEARQDELKRWDEWADRRNGNKRSSSSNQRSSNSTSTSSSNTTGTPSWRHPYYPTKPDGKSRAMSAVSRSRYTEGGSKPTPPRLLPEERRILEDNSGCNKCRRVNAGHSTSQCPDDLPSRENYRPVAYKILDGHSANSSYQRSTSSSYNNNKSQPTSDNNNTQPSTNTSSSSNKRSFSSDSASNTKRSKQTNAVQEDVSADSDIAVAAYVQELGSFDESFIISSPPRRSTRFHHSNRVRPQMPLRQANISSYLRRLPTLTESSSYITEIDDLSRANTTSSAMPAVAVRRVHERRRSD